MPHPSFAPQCAGLPSASLLSLSLVFPIPTGYSNAEKGLFAAEAVAHC